MALVAKQLTNAELTTSFVTMYTVPGATKTRITEIVLCNCAGATRTATICLVESGDSADDGAGAGTNAIMKAFDLPQGVPMTFAMNTWLDAADFISAKASGVDVTLIISGMEES